MKATKQQRLENLKFHIKNVTETRQVCLTFNDLKSVKDADETLLILENRAKKIEEEIQKEKQP